jgi:hypothetical protein
VLCLRQLHVCLDHDCHHGMCVPRQHKHKQTYRWIVVEQSVHTRVLLRPTERACCWVISGAIPLKWLEVRLGLLHDTCLNVLGRLVFADTSFCSTRQGTNVCACSALDAMIGHLFFFFFFLINRSGLRCFVGRWSSGTGMAGIGGTLLYILFRSSLCLRLHLCWLLHARLC